MKTKTAYYIEDRKAYTMGGKPLPGYYLVSVDGHGDEVVIGSKDRTRMFTPQFVDSVIQPHEALDQMNKRFTGVQFSGSMQSGSFLVQGRLSTKALLGESHDVNVWMYSTCSGMYSSLGGVSLTRIFCMNQFPGIFENKGYFWRAKHSTLDHNMEHIERLLDELPQHLYNWELQRQRRMDTPMDVYAFCQAIRDYLDEEHKWDVNKVLRLNTGLCAAFNHKTNANLPASVERAVQAISWLPSHGYTVQGTKQRALSAETQLKGNDTLVSISKYLDKVTGVAA